VGGGERKEEVRLEGVAFTRGRRIIRGQWGKVGRVQSRLATSNLSAPEEEDNRER